jgi:hypothetical protein
MEMVQSDIEIFLISEPVCLLFESFDLVVDAPNHGAELAGSICSVSFGDFGQVFDSGTWVVHVSPIGPCYNLFRGPI